MVAKPPELIHLENLLQFTARHAASHTLATMHYKDESMPLHAMRFGSESADVPVLFFIGGVHGVERIGSQVVLAFLDNFIQRQQWDETVYNLLQRLRIWFVPVVNPFGMKYHWRSNANRVDLMRNAPITANGRVTPFVGGHRISRLLPWHRGHPQHMEQESEALTQLVIGEAQHAPMTLLLDVHSGFGSRDRLWFPLASSRQPIEHLPEVYSLYQLLQRNYPHNDYIFEPQSQHYLTHGDLWDYAYLTVQSRGYSLLPLTLEMGSWRWVKKNPLQISRLGVFNPVKPHRVQRVLRRHLMLMEFLIRASASWKNWVPDAGSRVQKRREALNLWYRNHG